VRTYASATVFLDLAPKLDTGCVITDVRMPGLSGIDLLRRLKELDVEVPVIVITGHGDVPHLSSCNSPQTLQRRRNVAPEGRSSISDEPA
jgi:FixJ family two-component response regulator